jgi:hypothetical protein
MRLIYALILPLAGCVSTTELRGTGGQVAYLIECSGSAMSINACYKRAYSICPAGYRVLDAEEAAGPITVSRSGVVQGVERQIIVQCAQ